MQKKQWVIIIFVLALVGAAVPAYFFEVRPITVVGPAILKLRNTNAFYATVTLATMVPASMVKNAGDAAITTATPVVVVGQVQMNTPLGKSASGTGTLSLVGLAKDGKDPLLDVISGEDGISFVRATNISKLGTKTDALLADADGVWYATDTKALAGYFFRDATAGVTGGKSGDRPAATHGTLLNDISSGDMFGIPALIDNDVTGGVHISHFRLPLIRDATVGFMQDVQSALRARSLTDAENKAVAAAFDGNDTKLELWIDSDRKDILQAKLSVVPHVGNQANFGLMVKFTSWNVPVAVTPPTSSRPFSDLVARFAHPMY